MADRAGLPQFRMSLSTLAPWSGWEASTTISEQPRHERLATCCWPMCRVPKLDRQSPIRELGVSRIVLLTGDRRQVAEEIGKQLEMDEVVAEVLPGRNWKSSNVSAETNTVMMVGDGVNDALALARGDVGVAIGAAGSDVALQSADVALMSDDLRRLPTTIKLARRTRRMIHQNVLVGAGLSLGFVYLASIGLFGPVIGVLLHFAGPLFVVCNSARLLGFGQPE